MKNSIIFCFFTVLLLFTAECGNQEKKTIIPLTKEQETICNFIVRVFGSPNYIFYSFQDESRWEDYTTRRDKIWGVSGFVASHCSESLRQSIESKPEKNIWGYVLGGEDPYGYDRYEKAFCNVFLIVVTDDWYTYYAFYDGNFCSHSIHATLYNDEVVIDDIDMNSDYNMTLGLGEAKLRLSEWLMGAWVSETKDKYYIFENYGRCNQVELNGDFSPIITSFTYNVRGNKVNLYSSNDVFIQNDLFIQFNRQQDSLLIADDLVLHKILGEPIILINNKK